LDPNRSGSLVNADRLMGVTAHMDEALGRRQ
jgi:hypothetical protein